ncbi:MAG: hypothetical protein ACPGO3_09315 [Magnetospiraceae bacterium]
MTPQEVPSALTGFSGRGYTPDEDRLLYDMRNRGISFEEIAQVLDRPLSGVVRRARRLRALRHTGGQAGQTRRCLGCGLPFTSQGAGNRVCPSCRTSEIYGSGSDYGFVE